MMVLLDRNIPFNVLISPSATFTPSLVGSRSGPLPVTDNASKNLGDGHTQ
jgi:hypothetical protein